MRTGDYVWRWTYDLLYEKEALRRLPSPKRLGRSSTRCSMCRSGHGPDLAHQPG